MIIIIVLCVSARRDVIREFDIRNNRKFLVISINLKVQSNTMRREYIGFPMCKHELTNIIYNTIATICKCLKNNIICKH